MPVMEVSSEKGTGMDAWYSFFDFAREILGAPLQSLDVSLPRSRLPSAAARSWVVCYARANIRSNVARSGYINLLQPQDRRSKNPGDSVEAVTARRRLHDRGVTAPLLDAIAHLAVPGPIDVVLDAGCGDGSASGLAGAPDRFRRARRRHLGAGRRRRGAPLSRLPVDRRQCRSLSSFRRPVFLAPLSITGRLNPEEFRGVLRDDGRLLIALAAPDDLMELRSSVGQPGRDRVQRTVETFAHHFTLADQRRVTTAADLDAGSVQDVLVSIYRPMQARPAEATRVTFSLDLLLFRPEPPPLGPHNLG